MEYDHNRKKDEILGGYKEMSKKSSEKEINEFIETLKRAESVSISYSPPVPDMKEFYDAENKDCLVHSVAVVKFSVR